MQPNNQMTPNPNIYAVPQGPLAPNPNQPMVPQTQLPHDKPPVGLIVGLVVSILLLIAMIVFGFWAYSQMLDYKNNSDKKAAAAVTVANEKQKTELEAQFAEQEKSPLKSYISPSQSGSVKIVYPKTWSTYMVELADQPNPLDGYFYPDFVPNVAGKNNYSLRLQLVGTPYKTVIDSFDSKIKQGKVKASVYKPEQVPSATPGVRYDGEIEIGKKGAMVVLPLRDKTLKIWTENESALGDFNNTVLKNLTYSP